MEACATAHQWAREVKKLGHDTRLMPPSYVKAYVKRGKNDAADAAAIATGALRAEPTLLFIVVSKARGVQERPVMDQISDAYIFGLCAGLITFLVVPLAVVDGADDPATRFIAKWHRELARERRAYFRSIGLPLPRRQSKLRPKARRPLMPAQTRERLVKKVPAAAANKRRSTR